MKWTVFNAVGGLAWIAGLSFAKGFKFLGDDVVAVGDHRVLAGLSLGLAGLFLMVWINIRNPA